MNGEQKASIWGYRLVSSGFKSAHSLDILKAGRLGERLGERSGALGADPVAAETVVRGGAHGQAI